MKAYIIKNANGEIWTRTHSKETAELYATKDGVIEEAEVIEIKKPTAKFKVCRGYDILRRPRTAQAAVDFVAKLHYNGYAAAEIDGKDYVIKEHVNPPMDAIFLDSIIYVIDGVRCVKTSTHYETLVQLDKDGTCLGGYSLPFIVK